MKTLYIPLAIIILIGVLASGTQAQTAGPQKVIATIPFTFNVGQTQLPAGKYTFTVLNSTSDRKILQVRSVNGSASAIILTTSVFGNAADDAKLVFHRYGDRYFFAQAHMAGGSTSLVAAKSKAERAEKQAIASSGKKGVIVRVGG